MFEGWGWTRKVLLAILTALCAGLLFEIGSRVADSIYNRATKTVPHV